MNDNVNDSANDNVNDSEATAGPEHGWLVPGRVARSPGNPAALKRPDRQAWRQTQARICAGLAFTLASAPGTAKGEPQLEWRELAGAVGLTTTDIAGLTGLRRTQVRGALPGMVDGGLVKQHDGKSLGLGRAMVYVLGISGARLASRAVQPYVGLVRPDWSYGPRALRFLLACWARQVVKFNAEAAANQAREAQRARAKRTSEGDTPAARWARSNAERKKAAGGLQQSGGSK